MQKGEDGVLVGFALLHTGVEDSGPDEAAVSLPRTATQRLEPLSPFSIWTTQIEQLAAC